MLDFDKILFLDVETPNGRNDRICSIGLIQTDLDRNVLDRRELLVDPEEEFADRNIDIHGITPLQVKGKPCFSEVWQKQLEPLFTGALLVAHNAIFDLSVLAKDMNAYGIEASPAKYVCTKEMALERCPSCANYKLPTVCDYLGLSVGAHHHALDDTTACEQIFWALAGDNLEELCLESYVWGVHGQSRSNGQDRRHCGGHGRISYSNKTTAMRQLASLLNSLSCDGRITADEAMAALAFIYSEPLFSDDPCVHKIESLLAQSLADGDISQRESEELVELFRNFTNPVASVQSSRVSFEGKSFCLSGQFEHGSKEGIKSMIESRGGTCLKSVTKKCSYVVVGNCGNENWSMGNYGQKVKKAMEYKEKGVPIEIVREDDLFC